MRHAITLARFFLQTNLLSPSNNLLIAVVLPILTVLFLTSDLDRQDVLFAMFAFGLTGSFGHKLKSMRDKGGNELFPGDTSLLLLPVHRTALFRGNMLAIIVYAIAIQGMLTLVLVKCSSLPPVLRDKESVRVEYIVTQYGDTLTKLVGYSTDRERGATAKHERILSPSIIFDNLNRTQYWPWLILGFFVLFTLADGAIHFQKSYGRASCFHSLRSIIMAVLQISPAIIFLADILLPTTYLRHFSTMLRDFIPSLFAAVLVVLLAISAGPILVRESKTV